MFAPRKFASNNPAFDTMSTTRMSSCIVSGTACTQWIAAFGGMGSVKVASCRQPTITSARTDTSTAEDRNAIMMRSSLLTAPPTAGRLPHRPAAEQMPRRDERGETRREDSHEQVRAGPGEAPLVRVPHPGATQRHSLPAPPALPTSDVGHADDAHQIRTVGRPDQRPLDPGDPGPHRSEERRGG